MSPYPILSLATSVLSSGFVTENSRLSVILLFVNLVALSIVNPVHDQISSLPVIYFLPISLLPYIDPCILLFQPTLHFSL